MKKFWKYIMISAAAVALMPLAACNDDDEVDPYTINYVYVYQPNSTFANVEYKANGDFMSGLTDPLKVMPVRLTKPAPGDMQIEVAIDPTLVDEYNEEHETEYKFLEGAEILNPTMMIPQGEYISADSITVGFTDHSGFIDQVSNLILPIVIRSANGAVVSKSSRIFLTFNSSYRPNILTATAKVTFAAVTEIAGWENDVRVLDVNNGVKLTYTPYENVTVNLTIDGSKVTDFNSANGTDYEFKSDATLASNTITIGTDANAGSFSINTGDLTGVAAGKSYVIPVKVTAVNGASVEMTESNSIVYVVLRSVGREISMSTNTYTGTAFSLPDAATATVDGSSKYGSYTWINIINPNSWDYGYLNLNQELVVDFSQNYNLSSFYINNYYSSYAPTSLSLQTSLDGNTWTDWGTAVWETRKATYYINLSYAASTRYVKIIFLTGPSRIELDGIRFYAE